MATIKFQVLAGALQAKIDQLQADGADLQGLYATIGRVLTNRIRLGFRASRSPYGAPWAPLKSRIGQPLRDTGALLRSIVYSADSAGVTIGTNKVQARVHQFGATIEPKKPGGRLAFQIAGRWVFAKEVTIPARPYMPVNKAGQADLPPQWAGAVLQAMAKHLKLPEPAL